MSEGEKQPLGVNIQFQWTQEGVVRAQQQIERLEQCFNSPDCRESFRALMERERENLEQDAKAETRLNARRARRTG